MSDYLPRVITPTHRALLGEGPVWDEDTGSLYWVDIERGEVHRCAADGSSARSFAVGQPIGCLALRREGTGFVAGLEHSVALIDLDPLRITRLAAPEPNEPGTRCNDGKCDAQGRFWVGTCDAGSKEQRGWLYCIDPSGIALRHLGPFICTNGPAFSADGRRLYCVDSYGRTVYRCTVSGAGELSSPRVFTAFRDPSWGCPDGLTCDQEGCLWIAHWGGARVSRFSPDGELLDVIPMPVPQVTSCAFGGENLRTLFITSASLGVAPDSDRQGLSGAVFAVDVQSRGFPAWRFAG